MSWSAGEKLSLARLKRLSSGIPPDYTVFKDGNTYYAEAQRSGGTDYSGSNPTTIVHQARDALTGGGRILLKGGTDFNIGSSTIVLNKTKVDLVGEGLSSRIIATGDVPAIKIERPAGNINASIVENLSLIGPGYTNTSAHAIELDNAYLAFIKNIYASDVRHVIHNIYGNYIYLDNIQAAPITEWVTGEHYRFLYMNKGAYEHGGMLFMDDGFSFHARESGVVVEDSELLKLTKVIVAEPGYGDDDGSNGYGFNLKNIRSYTTLFSCEADTTHGNSYNVVRPSAHRVFLDINSCFGWTKTGYNAKGINIENCYGARIEGGEYNTCDGELLNLSGAYHTIISGVRFRAHSLAEDPGVYYDGIVIDNSTGSLLSDLVVETFWDATGKTGIKETNSICYINNIQFHSVTENEWGTPISAPNCIVENTNKVSYLTQTGSWAAPTLNLGNGTKIVVYNSTQAGYRLYVKANGAWRYVTLST